MRQTIFKYLLLSSLAILIYSCSNGGESRDSKNVKNSNAKVATITDFSATWCGACKQFKPVFQELKDEYAGKIEFKEVDVDQNKELTEKWNVQSLPTIIFQDKDGKEIARFSGYRSKEIMKKSIEEYSE